MPGLKGLTNVTEIMKRRQEERELGESTLVEPALLPTSYELEKAETEPPISASATVEKIYSDFFEKNVGTRTRKKYESGDMPRVHKILLNAICERTGVKQPKKQVVLSPILDEHQISRSMNREILSCLEYYGYLEIVRVPNSIGKLLEFRVLKTL